MYCDCVPSDAGWVGRSSPSGPIPPRAEGRTPGDPEDHHWDTVATGDARQGQAANQRAPAAGRRCAG